MCKILLLIFLEVNLMQLKEKKNLKIKSYAISIHGTPFWLQFVRYAKEAKSHVYTKESD